MSDFDLVICSVTTFRQGCRICIQRVRGAEWTFDLREIHVKSHVQSLSDKLSDFLATSFLHSCCFLLHVQRIFLKLEFFKLESLKKNTFQIFFRVLDGDFWGFRRKFSSTVVRTALVSMFFNRIYAIFFRTLREISLAGLSELHFTCPQDCDLGKHLFWKKIPKVLHFLAGNSPGFSRIFSSTVFRTALVSRFFNRIYATFFRTLRKISLAGLSELHSTCPQDFFHEQHLLWKKHFSVCISLFRRKLFRFSAKFFQHGNQNWLDFQGF